MPASQQLGTTGSFEAPKGTDDAKLKTKEDVSLMEIGGNELIEADDVESVDVESLLKDIRKTRYLTAEEAKARGWVARVLKGQCCVCECSHGFSTQDQGCRGCQHTFCGTCTSLEDD